LPLPPRSRPNASGASETSVTSNGRGPTVPESVDISVREVMKDDLPEGRVSDVDGDVEVEGVARDLLEVDGVVRRLKLHVLESVVVCPDEEPTSVVPNELHRIG